VGRSAKGSRYFSHQPVLWSRNLSSLSLARGSETF